MVDELDIPKGLAEIQPIREIIFDYLRAAIIDKRLHPGAKMVEREIAERFQVSRTPVREALQRLENEGFLERKQSKSYLVRSIPYEEMQEAYMLRLALEPLMVCASIKHLSKSEIIKLQNILDDAARFHRESDHEQVSNKLLEFDFILMEASRLNKLKEILSGLIEDLRRFRRSNISNKARRLEAVQEHRKILEAIIAGDEELAAQRTREHIQNSYDGLNNALKAQ